MDQATLVRDLIVLEEMALTSAKNTNLFLHISRVRELAEGGFYHCGVEGAERECSLRKGGR